MDRLSFEIAPAHFARQLHLDEDRAALASLASRCLDYLRDVTGKRISSATAPDLLQRMLLPERVPVDRSFVLGIYRQAGAPSLLPERLAGVLYFLHPPAGSAVWYVTLLLLEPAARGRGLGTAVHDAFARWASGRGGRHFVVSVARSNPRALRFWQDRLGYGETPTTASYCFAKPDNRSLERRFDPAPAWCL